jgi:large subunit ribosomal protein L13e
MTRIVSPTVYGKKGPRDGKGFSKPELGEIGISSDEAFRLGIPVDKRRGTKYDENVERLRSYVEEAKKAGIRISRPKIESKPKRGRAYRGLTSAGKKVRGLV